MSEQKLRQVLTGPHAAEESIRSGRAGELYLLRERKRNRGLAATAAAKGIPVHWTTVKELNRLSGNPGHRGAVFVCRLSAEARGGIRTVRFTPPGDGGGLVLLLDGITDTHNLGSILRSADQFAVQGVVVPAHRSAHDTRVASAASAGASSWVTLTTVANLVHAMEELKKTGYWIYGADIGGEAAGSVDLSGNVVLVLGSEGSGMRPLVRRHCDGLIRIPAAGHVDSFNVAVAAAILLYEVRRQQDRPLFPR